MEGQVALRLKAGEVMFDVIVVPGAIQEEIQETKTGAVKILVKAPPVEGKANRAVVALVAKKLGVPKGRVSLVRGTRSRRKVVAVAGLAPEEVAAKLHARGTP